MVTKSTAYRLKLRDQVKVSGDVRGYTITKVVTDEHSRRLRPAKGFRRHVRSRKAAIRRGQR